MQQLVCELVCKFIIYPLTKESNKMASTPKPIRKVMKGLIKEGHEAAKEIHKLKPYRKSQEKLKDKEHMVRLKEAHKSGSPVFKRSSGTVKDIIRKK